MRILVLNLLECKECTDFFKMFCDRLVCLFCCKTCKLTCFFCKNALVVYRNNNRDFLILLANNKVINTVTRSCVYATCTAFKSYMVADNNKRCSVDKRMSGFHIFKFIATDNTYCFIICDTCIFHSSRCKVGSHNIIFAVCLEEAVLIVRTYTNSNICRKCPSCCCPNYKICFVKVCTESGKLAHIVCNLKLNIN